MILEMETCGYLMEHYNVCQEIWEKYVPDTGKANELPAELLRLAEVLRIEAIENENKNWNEECENACDFLWHYLCDDAEEYEIIDKSNVRQIITCIRERGRKKEIYKTSVVFDYIEDCIAKIYLHICDKFSYEDYAVGDESLYNEDSEHIQKRFTSSGRKMAFQICIISLLLVLFIATSLQMRTVFEKWVIFLLGLILAGYLLWRQRPVWVELYSDRIRYVSFLGEDQVIFYTQMCSMDFIQKVYSINLLPIYGYTKYAIYVEGKNGRKKALNMNSFTKEDFTVILEKFLQCGDTREDLELCENMKNPYFYRRFSVPTKKLRETYYYIGKRVCIGLLPVCFVCIVWECMIANIYGLPFFERIIQAAVEMLFVGIFLLLLYLFIWLVLYRKEIATSKKVPEEVYVCQEYIQFDGEKFAFDKITSGTVVSSKFHCERIIEFIYDGNPFSVHFGKYHRFLPDYFKEYKTLELYLRGRGFKRCMQ